MIVDKKTKTFTAVLYDDTYQKDYGRLIFDTAEDAINAANKLPKPNTIIYQKIGKKIYKKTVLGIDGKYVGGVYDLRICLNSGEDISTKELRSSIFFNESDAK